MSVAYAEMIGGASGNMLLGALIDAGASLETVEAALRTIPVEGWSFVHRRVTKRGIAALYVDFALPGEDRNPPGHEPAQGHAHEHEHAAAHGRRLEDVLAVIERSGLSPSQRARAAAVYVRLAQAEAHVHGSTVERIHFHEVGAVDAILDVAAACVALDLLGVEELFCSAFPTGRGPTSMQHGTYPNPPPATAELLRGAPTYDAGIVGEMVTTTGAAILTALVREPGTRPALVAERIGYGAGSADFPIPNVLRLSVGRLAAPAPPGCDEVVVLEANVDDMPPQHFELALERVLAAGAYDAWLAPISMKKSRPAILFGALAPPEREAEVARAILRETTSLGVRVRRERRYVLERRVDEVATELGPVRVKTAEVDGALRRTLEYDDVLRIARERGRPVGEIAARLEELLPPS
ncbi:MAG: nickel pincer cofactor biosynthesis protein LarC [Candidatus Baltobacteraceae bacterium]